jgi:hypothetical protein
METMPITAHSWLVGSRGLAFGRPPHDWTLAGARRHPVLSLCRQGDVTWVGVTGGLWELRDERWIQRHDETLTEVLALCLAPGDRSCPAVVAGSPYGVATPEPDRAGAWRWSFIDRDLGPNERFTSCLLADPTEPDRAWVGTEAGLFCLDIAKRRMHPTNLSGTPVRALAAAHGRLWAGTDLRGVWTRASDGSWHPAGAAMDAGGIFSLAAAADHTILAGTERGIAVGDGEGPWMLRGPRLLVSALAVGTGAGGDAGEAWLAGASPGGLWYSASRGEEWTNIPGHAYVRAIASGGNP